MDRQVLPKAQVVPLAKKHKIVVAPPAVVLPREDDKSLVGDENLKIEDIPFVEEDISKISDNEDSDYDNIEYIDEVEDVSTQSKPE